MSAQSLRFPAFQVACRVCGNIFFICQPCWRGQAFCSKACARFLRLKCQREAQRRAHRTPDGRARNRSRQQAFRERKRRKKRQNLPTVTHHTTTKIPTVLDRHSEKVGRKRCIICKRGILFSFSRDLGQSLRRLTIRAQRGKHDIRRNLGRDPPAILR
jgi:hypothetical protein